MAHLHIFIFRFVYLSSSFVFCFDFKVIQSKFVDVFPTAISCEHDAHGTKLQDVRLNRISRTNQRQMLCQKGANCANISMRQENSRKFVFILRNIGPEATEFTYECAITVEKDDVDYTEYGTATTLRYDNVISPAAFISCKYEADASNVQLYKVSQNNTEEMVCQMGESCLNVALYQRISKEFVFVLLNFEQEAMNFSYQCRVTAGGKTERGAEIKTDAEEETSPGCTDVHQSELSWILIGLLAMMFLYSCLITSLYIRQTVTNWKEAKACENSTYVVMKPPSRRNEYD